MDESTKLHNASNSHMSGRLDSTGWDVPQALARLHDLIVTPFKDLATMAQACLKVGCDGLGVTTGIVSSGPEDDQRVLYLETDRPGLQPGAVFSLSAIEGGQPGMGAIVDCDGTGAARLRCNENVPLAATQEIVVSAPITVNGALFGTLHFCDDSPRPGGFSAAEQQLVEMLAVLLSRFLEREQHDTALRLVQERLQEHREMLDMSFQHTMVGNAIVDVTTQRIVEVNPALCRLLGYARDELIATTFVDVTHPEDRAAEAILLTSLINGQRTSVELEKRYIHRDGHILQAYVGATLVRDAAGSPKYLVEQVLDITDRKNTERRLQATNRELERLALTDSLTGLWNRRYFVQMLAHEWVNARRYGTPLSLIMLDVDRFKRLNDRFGHVVGDRILATIGGCLQEQARAADVVARYGGEEFAVLLPRTAEQAAYAFSERCRRAVARYPWGDYRPVTVSAGVASLNTSTTTADELVRHADQALYKAKAAGRNTIVINPAS